MSLNQMGLGILLSAKDEASEVLEKVHGAFERLEKSAEGAGNTTSKASKMAKAGVASLGVGLATLAGAFAIAEHADRFEQALADTGARMRATQEQMEELKNAAFSANVTMAGFSATDAALSLKALAEKGYNAERAMQTLNPALKLARVLGQEAAPTATMLAEVMGVYNVSAEGAGDVTDKMVKAMQMFGVTSGEIAPILLNVASGAQLVNASFEDTLLTVGLIKTVIPDAGRAAAAANLAMNRLADPHVQKKLHQYGVAVKDGHGKTRQLADVISNLMVRTEKMTEAQRSQTYQQIFGNRAAGGMTVVMEKLGEGIVDANGKIQKGSEALKVLRAQLEGAGGSADAELQKKLGTMGGQMEILRKSIDTTMTILGAEMFAPIFRPFVEGLKSAALKVQEFVKSLPEGTKQALGKLVIGFGLVASAIGAVLLVGAALPMITAIVTAIGAAVAAIAWPLVGAAAAVGGLILVWKALQVQAAQSGKTFEGVSSALHKIRLVFDGITQLFKDGGFSGAVRDELNQAGNGGVKNFVITLFLWFNRIKSFFSGLSEGFSGMVKVLAPVFDFLREAFEKFMEVFIPASKTAAENGAAFDSAGAAGQRLGQTFALVASLVAGALGTLLDTGRQVMTVVGVVYGAVSPIFSSMGQMVQGFADIVFGLLNKDWVEAWEGAKNFLEGIVRSILNTLLAIPRTALGVIDAVGSAIGKHIGSVDKLNALMNSVDKLMPGDVNVKHTGDVSGSQTPLMSSVLSPVSWVTANPGVTAATQTTQGLHSVAASNESVSNAVMSKESEPINFNATLKVDGDTLARVVEKTRRSKKERGYSRARGVDSDG